MSCEHLICAHCAGPVVEGRCPVCREARAHVVTRWRYDWDGGHVRGIDLFTVRDGLVTEKIAYVKG